MAGDSIQLDDKARRALADWITRGLEETGWGVAELARRSKVARTTLAGYKKQEKPDVVPAKLVAISNALRRSLPQELVDILGKRGYNGTDGELKAWRALRILHLAVQEAGAVLSGEASESIADRLDAAKKFDDLDQDETG